MSTPIWSTQWFDNARVLWTALKTTPSARGKLLEWSTLMQKQSIVDKHHGKVAKYYRISIHLLEDGKIQSTHRIIIGIALCRLHPPALLDAIKKCCEKRLTFLKNQEKKRIFDFTGLDLAHPSKGMNVRLRTFYTFECTPFGTP